MSSTSLAPPTFDLPSDNSNYEVWYLRAPAHLDISEVLNGVTLNVNTKLLKDTSPSSTAAADTSTNNSTLTKIKSKQDGQEYELTLADSSEINHLRLLLPHQDDDDSSSTQKLKAHNTPFQRYIHLTSVTTSSQEELVLAPARENAPRPAFGEMMGVNGSVPAMRLAYVPVPQKEGLKRRWAMPGSSGGGMVTMKPVKRVKVAAEQEQQQQPATPTSKSAKKKKKEKKEKKSKKSPKK